MSEMIERVAKRIASVNCPRSWSADGLSPMSDDEREVHRALARAAIEAMREPTGDKLPDFRTFYVEKFGGVWPCPIGTPYDQLHRQLAEAMADWADELRRRLGA